MKIIVGIFILIAVYVVYSAGIFLYRVHLGRVIADSTIRFERKISNAPYNVLVIGDSTAVGTGAKDSMDSTTGRLGQEFPSISITNIGVNGSKTKDLIKRLVDRQGQHYDLTILHTGANDIVRFTNKKQLYKDLQSVLSLADSISSNVVLITSGNIGTAPIFPWPVSWILSARTREIHAVFKITAKEYGVLWVPLYAEKKDDPFFENVEESYATDKFHPAARGYGIWYKAIRNTLESGGVVVG